MNEELKRKIEELQTVGGYLITITTYKPENVGAELQSWYQTNKFPKGEIPKVIEDINHLLEKEKIQLSTSFKE